VRRTVCPAISSEAEGHWQGFFLLPAKNYLFFREMKWGQ